MSTKGKNPQEAIKKEKKKIYKVGTGKSLTGTVTKKYVTRVYSPKEKNTLKWASNPVCLPTKDNPVVVLHLTQAQIDAIPRDQFDVVVLGPAHLCAPTFIVSPAPGEQLFLTFVTLVGQLQNDSNAFFTLLRNHSRNNGGDEPPANIFLTPIDENKMSDCIMRVVLDFFGNNKIITLHGHTFKVSEFCVLIHYYFLRINVLKRKGRKPFCEYLEKKVFRNKLEFTARTFNKYADNYKNSHLTDTEALPINFKYHADDKGQPLQKVFHEVGWNFHNSPYFEELREMKNNLEQFQI